MKFILILVLYFIISTEVSAQQSAPYISADLRAAKFQGASLINLKALSDSLTLGLETDELKFRSIYKWVCENIASDFYLYEQNRRKRLQLEDNPEKMTKWNAQFNQRIFKKLMNERRTVCTGYAYLVKELAYHSGISCVIVDGYGKTAATLDDRILVPNHSWNAVNIAGEWKLCDPTWSSGAIFENLKVFVPEFSEGYFLADPELFAFTHFPLDTAWLLGVDKTLIEFQNQPIIYKGALNHDLKPNSPLLFENEIAKGEVFRICFESQSEIIPDELYVIKAVGSSQATVNIKAHQISETKWQMEIPCKRKEKFLIHIRYKGQEVVSYKMIVR